MFTGRMNDRAESASVSAVFDNDMLLEHILDFAIHPTNKILCRETLCSIRCVEKCWKAAVSNFMRRNKQPLYKLVLDQNNSISGTPYVQQHGKILDNFLNFIRNRDETFCLIIKPEFFRLENYQSFVAILREVNLGLMELQMQIPINGGSLPCVFPNVHLPNLQELTIQLTEHSLDNLENDSVAFQQPVNIIFLLQSILNRNKSLKNLTIRHNHRDIPGIQYICLPTTITEMFLDCQLSDQDMELLVQNKLPSLKTFSFIVPNRILPDNLIFRILTNLQTSLRDLSIRGFKPDPQIFTNAIEFPVMANLKSLRMMSIHVQLAPTNSESLYKCFPKLIQLECALQTPEVFRPWIESSKLESVTQLSLQLIDITSLDRRPCVLPSLEILHGVRQKIPNVVSLTLVINGEETLGLKELLYQMTHLKNLIICVLNAESITNSDPWDSVLTGIPIEIIAALRVNPDYWGNFYVDMKSKPSIRLLENLVMLTLTLQMPAPSNPNNEMPSLISPLSFSFALNGMKNLKVLNLSGRFRVPPRVKIQWLIMDRLIAYI